MFLPSLCSSTLEAYTHTHTHTRKTTKSIVYRLICCPTSLMSSFLNEKMGGRGETEKKDLTRREELRSPRVSSCFLPNSTMPMHACISTATQIRRQQTYTARDAESTRKKRTDATLSEPQKSPIHLTLADDRNSRRCKKCKKAALHRIVCVLPGLALLLVAYGDLFPLPGFLFPHQRPAGALPVSLFFFSLSLCEALLNATGYYLGSMDPWPNIDLVVFSIIASSGRL